MDGVFGVPYLLDYVFDELMTLIQARIKSNKLATKIGNLLLSDMKFIYCSQTEFSNAWDLFQSQFGKKYLSFTDCVIIATAQTLGISKVASLDHHFKSWVSILP